MNSILKTAILLIILTSFIAPILAQDVNTAPPKKRIAVLGFTANNVDESLARIVRNNIELSLFESKKFEVLEHDRIDFILKERKSILECSDEECGSVLGEMLSAQFVILGSVTKLDKFIVQIKVIDASRKQLIIIEKTETDSEADLRNTAVDLSGIIAEEIENIGRKTNPLFFSAGFLYVMPLEYLKGRFDPGFGIGLSGGIEDILFNRTLLGIDIQYLYFNGKSGITHHAYMLPVTLFTGYRLPVWKFSFLPCISAGGSYNSIYYYPSVDSIDYSAQSEFEFIVKGGIKVEYNLTGAFHIDISSDYCMIFEREGEIEFVTCGLGAGMRF